MHRVPPWKIVVVVFVLLGSLWALTPTFQWYRVPHEYRSQRKSARLVEIESHLAEIKDATGSADIDRTRLQEAYTDESNRIKGIQDKAIRLGLDLQGGVHLVLDVDIEKAVKQKRDQGASDDDLEYSRDLTLEQATMVVRQRVDAWGVAEPLIQKVPPNQIVVELPGYSNPEHAADLLKTTAQLSFHLLAEWDEATRTIKDIDAQVPVDLMGEILVTGGRSYSSEFFVKDPDDVGLVKEILSRPNVQDLVPKKYAFKWSERQAPIPQLFGGDSPYRTLYLLYANAELTGARLSNAYFNVNQAEFNAPEVFLRFDRQGARIFARLTQKYRGRQLAVVLDDLVYCAPRILDEITGGGAVITGINDIEEARKIAVALRAGALPADIRIAENDVVGASLGEDSVRKGVISGVAGLIVVIAFMVFYYSLCGVIADMALILNLIILMAGMALLKATLTLPGIAGVILTIGMAVDANVLIYERMREELGSRRSKTLPGIVDRSYSRAFMTIFDSNLTTLMTAVVLFQFGTGPIKGYAVTLTMGLAISMFTAVFVTRIVFDYLTGGGAKAVMQDTIPVGRFRIFPHANYDFIRYAVPAVLGSVTILVAGGLSIFLHSGVNKGIDFAGGTLMYLNFKKPIEVNEVRVALPDNLKDSIIQKVVAGDRNQINLRAKTSKQEEASQILAALKQAMPDNEPEVLRQQIVGPQVGEGLAKQAAWCIIFGSLMILLYVTLRFEFIYAAAAVIALAHDALITVSVFSLLDKEFTLTIVAAILTIIGYSANDTIVIFDRIRENCRHKEVEMKKSMKAFRQELNRSVNQTLSRTFLTTLLTLFVVLTIFVFGGEVIHDFVFALLIGMIAGTYSTVFIATPIVFWWRSRKVA